MKGRLERFHNTVDIARSIWIMAVFLGSLLLSLTMGLIRFEFEVFGLGATAFMVALICSFPILIS